MQRATKERPSLAVVAIGLFLAVAAGAGAQGALDRLTIVLDRENLPYSSRRGAPPGLDTEIALEICETLGATLEVQWLDTLDVGLLSPLFLGEPLADAAVGVAVEPKMVEENLRVGERALFTIPYASARYVLVTRGEGPAFQSLDEVGRTPVGVEVGSVAAHELWNAGFLVRRFGSQERVLDALASGDLDLGVLWPNCGWLIDRDDDLRRALEVHPVRLGIDKMQWNLAVAVAPRNRELLARLDSAILTLRKQGRFKELFVKYKLPYFEPFEQKGWPER